MAKVGEGERELDQHLPNAKSGSILRLCHRRYHHGYALAEGMERGVVGGVGGASEGWDCERREAQIRDCLSFQLYLWLSGGGLRR
jgi:hypothetical protein